MTAPCVMSPDLMGKIVRTLRDLGARRAVVHTDGSLEVEFFEPPPLPVVAPIRRPPPPPAMKDASEARPEDVLVDAGAYAQLESAMAGGPVGVASSGRSVLAGLTADDPLFDGVR